VAAERRHDDNGERWRCELDEGVEESKRELESEARRCGSGRGSSGVCISGRESVGEAVTVELVVLRH
jgi:hypothetical protein